jgi:hypothetical protein
MRAFSKILGQARKQKQKDEERERECMTAIAKVLETYGCMLKPILKGDERSIYADILIEALPEPQNDPGHDAQPPGGPGASPVTEASTAGQIKAAAAPAQA